MPCSRSGSGGAESAVYAALMVRSWEPCAGVAGSKLTLRRSRCGRKPGSRPAASPPRQVDVARAVAVVLPHHVAEPALSPPRQRQARPALLARAGARVVHALGGREGLAGVEAGGEEDVVVPEAVVLPGDEERAVVGSQARVPLVRGRVVVGVESYLGVVELAVGREARAPVVTARVEDVRVGLARAEVGPHDVQRATAVDRERRPLVQALEVGEVVHPDVRAPGGTAVVAAREED